MSRGARQLTKAEKDKLKLHALIDKHRWQLTGTLVPERRIIEPADLKRRVDSALKPSAKFVNCRNVVVINCNVWAEQIVPGDEE